MVCWTFDSVTFTMREMPRELPRCKQIRLAISKCDSNFKWCFMFHSFHQNLCPTSWWKICWLLMTVWGSTSFVTSANAGPEQLKDRLLGEALQQWREYEGFVALLQGEMRFKHTIDGKIIQDRNVEFKQNRNCKLYINQSLLKPKLEGEVLAYNTKYAFTLKRIAPDHPWALAGREDRNDTASTLYTKMTQRYFDSFFFPLLRIPGFDVSISQLVEQTSFRILGIKMVHRNGEELVQLDFDNAHQIGEGVTPIQGGTLFLDSSRSWCLRSCTLQAQWRGKTERTKVTQTTNIENQLADVNSIRPLPKKVIEESKVYYEQGESGPRSSSWEMVYDLREPTQPPGDEEFTLSAFGLPEPGGIDKRPMRWYLWVALSGILCLGLAALFRRLAHRAKKTK